MDQSYTFRAIEKEEVPVMFSMILQRMKWMDAKGLKLWNTTNYAEVYPQPYYEERQEKGEVFVLVDNTAAEIVGAAVLKQEDDRWDDAAPSLYLHNFVTKESQRNVGSVFLRFAEEYAVKMGKQYLRLDSAENSPFLTQYYGAHGFLPVGKCEEGLYKGVLRQKKLSR